MAYFEDVIVDHLKTNRHWLLSPGYLLDLNNSGPLVKHSAWWIDILAADFEKSEIIFCEVSYSKTQAALLKRLNLWNNKWKEIKAAMHAVSKIPETWNIRVQIYLPESYVSPFEERNKKLGSLQFDIETISIEDCLPWNRKAFSTKAAEIKRAALVQKIEEVDEGITAPNAN